MLPVNAKAMPRMQKALQDLAAQAEKELLTDGVAVKDITVQLLVDVRYCGQSFELPIEWSEDRAELGRRFHAAHQQRYGHADQEAAIEVVTVRVRGVGATVKPSFQPIARGRQTARAKINEGVYDRRQLKAGNRIAGPAVIVEDYSTTLLDEGWESVVDRWGNLLLERKGA
jgi:N-methylhydantoinase A